MEARGARSMTLKQVVGEALLCVDTLDSSHFLVDEPAIVQAAELIRERHNLQRCYRIENRYAIVSFRRLGHPGMARWLSSGINAQFLNILICDSSDFEINNCSISQRAVHKLNEVGSCKR